MNKQNALKVINVLLAIVAVVTGLGGVIKFFADDAIPDSLFISIHPKFGVALVVLIIIHIYLNWSWIKTVMFKKKPVKK